MLLARVISTTKKKFHNIPLSLINHARNKIKSMEMFVHIKRLNELKDFI